MRKRNLMILCFLLVMSVLIGCSRTMQGTEELIEKALEEIPVAEADEIDIQYAGLCGKDDLALIWFISGNEYQAHYYLPMECKVVGKDEYTFEHTYKPMDRGEDIAVLQWKGGYCFLINNPDCVAIRLTAGGVTNDIEIEKDAYPYIYYHEIIPEEYVFLDSEGHRYQFSYRIAGNILCEKEELAEGKGQVEGRCCHEPYPYGAPDFPEPHFDLEFWVTLPWVLEEQPE